MKDKLPSYTFKVGQECWCMRCQDFHEIAVVSVETDEGIIETYCGCEYYLPDRPLTLAEAKLLGLEPPRKTKKVTMYRAIIKLPISNCFTMPDNLYESEQQARHSLGESFIALSPAIEFEVDE